MENREERKEVEKRKRGCGDGRVGVEVEKKSIRCERKKENEGIIAQEGEKRKLMEHTNRLEGEKKNKNHRRRRKRRGESERHPA